MNKKQIIILNIIYMLIDKKESLNIIKYKEKKKQI